MQYRHRNWVVLTTLVVLSLLSAPFIGMGNAAQVDQQISTSAEIGPSVSDSQPAAKHSHQVIVQLESPSLSEYVAAAGKSAA